MGWSGPCPPPVDLASDREHRRKEIVTEYFFKLYALDIDIALGPDATRDAFLQAIDGHILAGGELVGEYVGRVTQGEGG